MTDEINNGGSKVSYKDFSEAVANINKSQSAAIAEITKQQMQNVIELTAQHNTGLSSIKTLILQLDKERKEASRLRHESISGKLHAQDEKMVSLGDRLESKMQRHQDEDDEVEKRVTIVEETLKRIMWLSVLMSAIAAWEAIKSRMGVK